MQQVGLPLLAPLSARHPPQPLRFGGDPAGALRGCFVQRFAPQWPAFLHSNPGRPVNMSKVLFSLVLLCATAAACGGDDETVTPAPDAGTTDTTPDTTPDAEGTGTPDTAPETDTEAPDDGSGGGGGEEVLLEQVSLEVFEVSCGGLACHTGGGVGGGLSLENDAELRDRLLEPSLGSLFPNVTPGDINASYLWHKCEGTHRSDEVGGTGARMPLGLAPLTDEQRSLLQNWIEGGAL